LHLLETRAGFAGIGQWPSLRYPKQRFGNPFESLVVIGRASYGCRGPRNIPAYVLVRLAMGSYVSLSTPPQQRGVPAFPPTRPEQNGASAPKAPPRMGINGGTVGESLWMPVAKRLHPIAEHRRCFIPTQRGKLAHQVRPRAEHIGVA
jgi:hypothetical protein